MKITTVWKECLRNLAPKNINVPKIEPNWNDEGLNCKIKKPSFDKKRDKLFKILICRVSGIKLSEENVDISHL